MNPNSFPPRLPECPDDLDDAFPLPRPRDPDDERDPVEDYDYPVV